MTGAEGFKTTASQLRTGAGKFDPVISGLNQTGNTLSAKLDAQGACWGDDETGQEFAKDYVPAAQELLKAFDTLSRGTLGIQQAVQQAANAYDTGDQNAQENLPGGS